jgi:hypothetical protein
MDNIEIIKKTEPTMRAVYGWAEKNRPELVLDLGLRAFVFGGICSILLSGLSLLLGMGILKAFGAFLVFGMSGFIIGAWRSRAQLLEAYKAYVAEHPDKA